MSLISRLQPMQYEYRTDIYQPQEQGDDSEPTLMRFPQGQQFGFLAQDLEKVLPNAVMTRKDGYKAVNYQNLVPVMVQGMQEQEKALSEEKAKVAELETKVDALVHALEEIKAQLAADKTAGETGSTKTTGAYLEQNTPNPFNENTVLKYFVPENMAGARILIRSEQGALEILRFDITHKGYGNVIISGNTLTTGTYTCELYIGDKMVDYKRMLLVK
jgi:hypothetical protein